MKAFLVLAAVVVAGAAAGPAAPRLTQPETELVRAVNQARAQHGLAPLRVDPALVRAARTHSRTILRTGSFSHGDVGRRVLRFGARAPAIGENLAWGTGGEATPAAVVQSWLASPPHRRNILRAGFRRIGVGRAVGTFRGYPNAAIVTADFAGR